MEKDNRPYVAWQLVDDFMTAVLTKLGLPEDEARLCSDVLLESDRRGIESHGCNRQSRYFESGDKDRYPERNSYHRRSGCQ